MRPIALDSTQGRGSGPRSDAPGRATAIGESESLVLRAAAEAELSRTGGALTFPRALETRYTSDTAAERALELRTIIRLGALLYFAGGVTLKVLLADPLAWRMTAMHLGGVTMVGLLLSQRFFRTSTSGAAREAALLACCLIGAVAPILSLLEGARSLRAWESIVALLPVNFILIFVPLRFPAAVALLAVALGAFAATILASEPFAGRGALFPIGIMAALCLPALVGVRTRERAMRRLYLHGLLQRLRGERLAQENAALEDLTLTDSLTGVANRRRLDAELAAFCASPDDGGALLLIDVDRFKDFNDRFGHLAGDECLREVAGRLSANLRRSELLARFGGEEFAVLLPRAGPDEAAQTAERLCGSVRSRPFLVGGHPVDVTVSIGLTIRHHRSEPEHLIRAADSALYAAKNAGRNQVRPAPSSVAWNVPATATGAGDDHPRQEHV